MQADDLLGSEPVLVVADNGAGLNAFELHRSLQYGETNSYHSVATVSADAHATDARSNDAPDLFLKHPASHSGTETLTALLLLGNEFVVCITYKLDLLSVIYSIALSRNFIIFCCALNYMYSIIIRVKMFPLFCA